MNPKLYSFAALSVAALVSVLAGCSGCASAPSSHIHSQDMDLQLPKDASFSFLNYKRSFVDTNGVTNSVSLVISNGVFKMNPDVINAKTARDLQLFNAGANAAGKIAGAAAAASVP